MGGNMLTSFFHAEPQIYRIVYVVRLKKLQKRSNRVTEATEKLMIFKMVMFPFEGQVYAKISIKTLSRHADGKSGEVVHRKFLEFHKRNSVAAIS